MSVPPVDVWWHRLLLTCGGWLNGANALLVILTDGPPWCVALNLLMSIFMFSVRLRLADQAYRERRRYPPKD